MGYVIEMCIPNIKRWWKGKALYQFETINEVTEFIKKNLPNQDRNIKFIIENDKTRARGNLANTSWYLVRKGARLMTDYTAF